MKNKKDDEQYIKYAVMIQGALSEMFDKDSESDYKIDLDDFQDDKKATDFIHALANVVPCNLYNKLTNNKENSLSFNHIANTLCFQYSKKGD